MHNDNEFCLGDVVKLKSGGPKMVIDYVAPDGSGEVIAVWVDSLGSHKLGLNKNSIRKISTENKKSKEKIKLGDVVILPSGSPEMTVSIINIDMVTVEWFDSNNVFSYCFPLSALKKAC